MDTEKPSDLPARIAWIRPINLCSPEGMDQMMRGRIIDGRRYLGNGSWEHVDHEQSRTNERKEAQP